MTRREGKRHHNGIRIFFIIMVLLTIAAAVAFWLFLKMEEARKQPVYRYFSVSEEAAARAYVWLNQIEEMPFSYQEIKELIGDVKLEVVLTPTREKGVYEQALSEGTYEECDRLTREAFEAAYREVLRHRFLAAGYEELSDELLDNMMREVYGVSVSEYLAGCNVQLLPTLEEVTEMYSGEVADE